MNGNLRQYKSIIAMGVLVMTLVIGGDKAQALTSSYGKYPGNTQWGIGIFKMSLSNTTVANRGTIGIASNISDPELTNAYARIRNSTKGSAYLPTSIWPNGINLVQNNSNGTWNQNVDILFSFVARPLLNGQQQSPGETFRYAARQDFCQIWKASYPCGARPTIEFDTARWNGYDAQKKDRLVMHEMGHALGILDNCSEDSIMNNGATFPYGVSGAPVCNPRASDGHAKWLEVMAYQNADNAGISSVYR